MPFGIGSLGWAYGYPYWDPWAWRSPWYRGVSPYWSPWGTMPKEQEIAMLEDQARALEGDLEDIRKRLEELKKGGE